MIEKIVLNYLNDALGVKVCMEEEENMPQEYVLVEKTGSGKENHIFDATIVVQSFSDTMYHAAMLNEKVKAAMENIVVLDDITRCDLNTDYNYTDTSRKKYRYQAVFDITHY